METTVSSSAGVKPAITAADVVAFLKAAADSVPAYLAGRVSVGCCTTYYKRFYASAGMATTQFADTPSEAVALLVADIGTPEQEAEEKRKQAAKLLAEADALSPKLTPALVIQEREGAAA